MFDVESHILVLSRIGFQDVGKPFEIQAHVALEVALEHVSLKGLSSVVAATFWWVGPRLAV